jgi:hypothetical protein
MRKSMGGAERSAHDKAWCLDFGDPDTFLFVPPEYLGEPAAKKGFLSRFTGKAAPQSQDLAEVAKHEHPMAINMGDSLAKAVRENPEMLHQADDRGLTLLHQLALASMCKCRGSMAVGADWQLVVIGRGNWTTACRSEMYDRTTGGMRDRTAGPFARDGFAKS